MPCLWVVSAALSVLALAPAPSDEPQEVKLANCPAAVKKTFEAEAPGGKIANVTKETDADEETYYWAEVTVGGKIYSIGVLEDGTLAEMNLAVDHQDVPFHQTSQAVQAGFRREAFGEKVESVGKDMKYGIVIYETVVTHKGKAYELVIAEDGTLVEKTLIIDDEEIELAKCPAAVKTAFEAQAKDGKVVGDITRSTGIVRHTYEAEVEIRGKVYLVEIAESGALISKSLEAGED